MSLIGVEARAQQQPKPEDFIKEVPLELFGGLCTEMSSADLPEGASPLCQDVDFELGSVFTRFGLTAFSAQVQGSVNYIKSIVLPNGDEQTLILDSSGNFYVEDISNNPGVLTPIGTVLPGSFAHSVSAFGREYIAFHNHMSGTDIPRQWDGTFFDRVSQDGPGAGPIAQNFLPSGASIGNPGGGTTATIIASPNGVVWGCSGSIVEDGPTKPFLVPVWNCFTVTTLAPHGFVAGQAVTLVGVTNAIFNQQWGIFSVTPTTFTVGNSVSAPLQIPKSSSGPNSGSGTATVGPPPGSITIQRANNFATAFTTTAHGFNLGWTIQITGVTPIALGGGISAIAQQTGTVTVTTTTAHGLTPGSIVLIAGVSDATYNGQFTVVSVLNSTQFTYQQVTTNLTSSGGTVSSVFNGTFIITGIPSANSFTYSNIGPTLNAVTAGTVVVIGNVTAGTHQVSQAFLTRQGYITKFSPPTIFVANGAQFLSMSQLAIGPPNVKARILAFTAAGGAFFYFILIPTVGSATGTQINDNTSTSALIDFSDATLLSASAADQQGADYFAQDTLGPCLGVFQYADRMAWWGELNAIDNFLNLSFDGGFSGNTPLGWAADPVNGAGGASSLNSVWGFSYAVTGDGATAILGMIAQSAASDYLNQPILIPNTSFSCRIRLRVSGAPVSGTVVVELFSATAGSLGTFAVQASTISSTAFGFYQGVLGTTGATVPSDLQLRYYVNNTLSAGAVVSADELAIFQTDTPTLNALVRMSYVIAPEQFDANTGFLGISGLGSRPVTACGELRDTLYICGDPGLFGTSDNGQEPDTWSIGTISRRIGCVSVDGIGGDETGEDWLTLSNGLKGEYIFNGQEPMKISQEVQPDFDILTPNAVNTIWKVNDITNRKIYLGVPINGATLPNVIYMMNYREMNASWELASQKPIHISYSGKMVAWDMSRKWAPWNIVANCGALIIRPDSSEQLWFGNGINSNKIYSYDVSNRNGDDGVAINSIYFPFFFVSRDMEQNLQMGLGRKYYDYIRMFIFGSGILATLAISDSLTSPRAKALANRTLISNPGRDMELGVNWTGDRTTFGIQTAAIGAWFQLSKMVVSMKQDSWFPKAGRA